MSKEKNKITFCLFLIILLALFLRLFRLESLPLFGDELDVGYQAFSLLKTAKSYTGQILPTYLHSFSESRAPLLIYTTIPFVGIFGPNTWGVRLAPVFFGILNIYLLFKLVQILTKNQRLSLLSAFLLTLAPWHIHYSRAAFEVTLLIALLLGGTLSFFKNRPYLSFSLFVLTFYTYNTANIFTPLLAAFLVFSQTKNPKEVLNTYLKPGLLAFFISLPIVLSIFSGQASQRFSQISIFSDSQTIHTIVYKRNTGLGPSKERFLYNKFVFWSKEFLNNYSSSFSPQFLFAQGDANPRHSVPGFGQFPWVSAPLFLLGIYQLLKSKQKKLKSLFLFWLFISPLPSALTIGGGTHATRLFLMLPPLVLISAFGMDHLLKIINKIYLPLLICFLFLVSTLPWFYEYLVHYPKEQSLLWHYGYRQAFEFLKPLEGDYRRVFINNSYQPALLPYLFWTQKDPSWFQKTFTTDQPQDASYPGFPSFSLSSKTYFGSISEENKIAWLEKNLSPTDLYLAFQGHEAPGDWDWAKEPPSGFKILKAIYNPWDEPLAYWMTKTND
jgi:4-amino-4-deoxy-L-arabinose transferase-like glycosyltransferase